jgi:TonB family protein
MADSRTFRLPFFGVVLVGVMLLGVTSFVYGQGNDTKSPGTGDKPATGTEFPTSAQDRSTTESPTHAPTESPAHSASSAPTQTATGPMASAKALDQLEVLTDTMGVDFGPYLTQVTRTVKQNWFNLMPPSVYPPELKQGLVTIKFFIQKDGRVKNMELEESSGNVPLDRAAWASITASNPFGALPKEFPGERVGLRLHYYYNPQVIAITPSVGVRVAAGARQEFSASGKDNRAVPVTWKVSGTGCSNSACGTISEDGLYTAPIDLPKPATIYVEATARTGVSQPARVEVTVVPAISPH